MNFQNSVATTKCVLPEPSSSFDCKVIRFVLNIVCKGGQHRIMLKIERDRTANKDAGKYIVAIKVRAFMVTEPLRAN